MIYNHLICSQGSSDVTLKCSRTGVIDTSDVSRKRVALFNRSDVNLKLLAMSVSKEDKTWELITYNEASDGNYTVIGFDDSGVYNADIMDKVSLFNKTFLYSGSDLQKLGETLVKLNTTLIGVNRLILDSFCNWLVDFKANDLNRNYILTNLPNENYLNVKSVIFDIESNWSSSSYMGIRRIEFYDLSNNLITLSSSDFTAYATSQYGTSYLPRFAFETSLSKIGTDSLAGWESSTYNKQRLICVFNTPRDISKIVINNLHYSGGGCTFGVKSTMVMVSSDTITSTVWGSAITNGKIIFAGDIPQHISANTIDDWTMPKHNFGIPIGTGIKSIILDIKNNHGAVSYIGVRRVELYSPDGVLIPLTTSDMTCYGTCQGSTSNTPTMTFTTSLSKVGGWTTTQWLTLSSTILNQRIVCVLNTVRDIGFIVVNNGHTSGSTTDCGAKETKIYLSTDTITSTIYGAAIANSVLVFDGILPKHSNIDAVENIPIVLNSGFNLTTMSGQVVDLSLLPLETGAIIKTIEDNSFTVSSIVNNKIVPANPYSINCSIPIKNINPIVLSKLITYEGKLNPCTITSNSKIPSLRGEALTSIAITELGEAIIPPVDDTGAIGDFCLQSNTTNGSTVFTDISANNYPITSYGGIVHSTAKFKYGTSSILFDGSNDYLQIAPNNSFNFGTGDFTMDFFICINATTMGTVFELDYYSSGISVYISNASSITFYMNYTGYSVADANFIIGVWKHIALVRTGGSFNIYMDGVLKLSNINYSNITTTYGLRIGYHTNAGTGYLNGHIASFRVTKGKALWLSNFTPPIALYLPIPDPTYEDRNPNINIYYSLSFDNKRTYKVWATDNWRAIASNLDSVHGVSGDSEWYYRDNADVWSKSGIDNVIATVLNKATSYSNNQMDRNILAGLTDTQFNVTGGFIQSQGYFDIAFSLVSSEYGISAYVKDLIINDAAKQVWELDPINIGVTSSTIGSSISWGYNVDATYDLESKVKVYAMVSDKTTYSLCSNGGAIPQISVGDDLTGKQLFVKVVYDKLVLPAAVDPAASMVFNITIS